VADDFGPHRPRRYHRAHEARLLRVRYTRTL